MKNTNENENEKQTKNQEIKEQKQETTNQQQQQQKQQQKQKQHHHATAAKKSTKPNQLIHHIYSKTIQLIIESRIEQLNQSNKLKLNPSNQIQQQLNSSQTKLDKWFNLELQDPDYFKEELKTWKSISSLLFNYSLSNSTSSTSFPSNSPQQPNYNLIPVLILETILDIQQLPPNSFLTFLDTQGQEVSVDHRISQPSSFQQSAATTTKSQIHKNIVIEKWSVSLVGPFPSQPGPELPTVYRHSIIHFRAFYSFLRTMPASSLFHRLKNPNNKEHGVLKIGCRLSPASPSDPSQPTLHHATPQNSYPQEIDIHQPLSNSHPHHQDSFTNFNFPFIQTPFGFICTQVTYRNQVEFRIGDKERVLSSRFRNEDQLERPLSFISHPTNFHRPDLPNFTRSGSSVPASKHTNPFPQTSNIHQSDLNSLNHPSEFLSGQPRPAFYGSLSTRRQSAHGPSNPNYFDPLLPGFEPTKNCENSLTAEILAATQSSPFVSSGAPNKTHRPQTGNVTTCNSSALTAKLVAHRQSLPPVLSNALPLPTSSNRPNSSVTTPGTGNNRIGGSTGASPRQFSVSSSSPLSGPSSSIRTSNAIQPLQYQRTSSTPSHLLRGASPPTSSGSIGSYPPISGSLSPLSDQSHTTNSSSRPIIPSQPMVRRYSSSRHSRSFGQASSSGGGSLLTAGSGSLGAKRRTFSISKQPSFDTHSQKLIDDDRNKINEFLHLINSQIIPPPNTATAASNNPSRHLNSPPYQLSFTLHHARNDCEKRMKEIKSPTAYTSERQEAEESALVDSESNDNIITTKSKELAIENEEDEEEENKLSRLVKEKLDLTLKKLAGSVFTSSREEIPMRIPTSNKLIKFDDANDNNDDGLSSKKNIGGENTNNSRLNNHRNNSEEHNQSLGVGLSSSTSGSSRLAMLQGLKEEQEDELEHEINLDQDDDGLSIRNFDHIDDQVDSIEVGVGGIRFEL